MVISGGVRSADVPWRRTRAVARATAIRSAAVWVMPWPGRSGLERADRRLVVAADGDLAKSWLSVTAWSAGLSATRRGGSSMNGAEGRQLAGGTTTTPRGVGR